LGCQDENDRGENGLSEKLNTQIEESEENGSWHQLFYQKINEVDSMYKKPSQKTKYWLALTQGYLTNKMPEEAEKSLLQALRWQKDYTDIDQQIENIAETLHINAKRKAISKTYYKVIVDYYPSSDFVTKAKDNLPEDMSSLQNQMEDLDEIIVKRLSENNELSPILIKDYISVAQLLTIFTDNIQAYTYLNKAAALSRGYGDINMAEVLYDWVILENPENAIAAKSLFEKGFMLDQSGFTENATITYNRFLQEYPDHQLASQVRILRDNVSESEEELLERLKSMKEDSDSLATQ
jgi:tetratricopeptide (TPR) repeat protein